MMTLQCTIPAPFAICVHAIWFQEGRDFPDWHEAADPRRQGVTHLLTPLHHPSIELDRAAFRCGGFVAVSRGHRGLPQAFSWMGSMLTIGGNF
jgi:hypothetical protein